MRSLLAILLFTSASVASAAGPRVDIVLSESPPKLVQQAADELAADLKRLYDADVHVGLKAPGGDTPVILVGTPESGAHLKPLADPLPKLSQQGHAVLSRTHKDRPVLVVVGGSPAAVYWAAAELAHALGIRTMLYGDVVPVDPPAFTGAGFDLVREPRVPQRAWHMDFDSPIGPAMWSLADQQKLLRQLARLKYNRLVLESSAESPAAAMSGHKPVVVSGDTAGRAAFRGAKRFENPHHAAAADEQSRLRSAEKLIAGITEQAESLGMAVEVRRLQGNRAATPARGLLPCFDVTASGKENSEVGIGRVGIGDADLAAYSLSRAAFDVKSASAPPLQDLVTPICGDGVADRVQKAFGLAEQAAKLIEAGDPAFSDPAPGMVMRHYATSEPPPEWWGQAREHYLNAMNEMYRANTRAREGGRSYTLYFARRFEFAFEYTNCLTALRKAAVAKAQGDSESQIAELEKAVESINGGLNAMAAIARSPSDRAIIAILNEHGYRPLVKELDAADEAASK